MTDLTEVPWAVEDGAAHSVQSARNLAFMLTGGNEGVASGAAMEVRELAAPGGSVRVFPGTASVLNRAVGAVDEMYVQRESTTLNRPISPTDGSGPRSDMIVLRIENPGQEAGWDGVAPEGPFSSYAVISDVPSNATTVAETSAAGQSAIPLARIDIPINTSVITQAMITDLRTLARPRSKRFTLMATPAVGSLTSAGFSNWPDASFNVSVPEWATGAHVITHLSQVRQVSGACVGQLRVTLGALLGAALGYDQDDPTVGEERQGYTVSGDFDVAALQGSVVEVKMQGLRSAGPGFLHSASGTGIVFDVEFFEELQTNV